MKQIKNGVIRIALTLLLALIIGGAGSGKSEYAEKLAVRLAGEAGSPLIYLATMVSGSREADARIRKHRQNREGRGFRTIERYTDLSGLQIRDSADIGQPGDMGQPGDAGQTNITEPTVLLEDLGNLVGNEMFLPEGRGQEAVLQGIRQIAEQSANLIIVGNEVFSDGQKYDGETQKYLHNLAQVQRELAEVVGLAVEVVCGCPNVLKQ